MCKISTMLRKVNVVICNDLRETPHSDWVECPNWERLRWDGSPVIVGTTYPTMLFTSEVHSSVEKFGRGLMVLAAGSVFGQTPAFEVASIKPSEPITPAMVASGKLHAGMKIDGKRVDIGNFALMQLICKAYDVKTYQVSGPSWLQAVGLAGQRFDIVANLPEGATKEQVPQMLQNLLAERFKLVMHQATRRSSRFMPW